MKKLAPLTLLNTIFLPSYAVVINEVADKGTSLICDGEDWVELYNDEDTEVSLNGYVLHDDKGLDDDGAFSFAADAAILGKSYLVLCCNGDGASSPSFKIGGDDAVTLYDTNLNQEIDTTGMLPDLAAFDFTYARDDSGVLIQTTTPTPNEKNIITTVPDVEEISNEDQDKLGMEFFGMDENGEKLEGWDEVISLYVDVDTAEWASLKSNPYTETYIPVQEFRVVSSKGTQILPSPGRMRPRGQSTLFYPICMGEEAIPFKLDFASSNASQTLFGVETAYLRTHLSDKSHMQEWVMHRMLARFGLPYLRTRHVQFYVNNQEIGFYTFMEAADQEYVVARNFKHLDYEFAKETSALYKVKTLAISCGNEIYYSVYPGDSSKCTSPDGQGGYDCCALDEWNEPKTCEDGYVAVGSSIPCWYTCIKEPPEDILSSQYPEKCNSWADDCCADLSWGEPQTCEEGFFVTQLPEFCEYTCTTESPYKPSPPYEYERGDHREAITVKREEGECWDDFFTRITNEQISVSRSFFDYGYQSVDDCGDFLLSSDLIDRDFGSKDYDESMKTFIDSHLSVNGICENDDCSKKRDLKDEIDVENWLKNFAVYAVALVSDSPMGNGNNYFLATTRDGTIDSPKWKIVPYDHNTDVSGHASLCSYECGVKDLADWSIMRPTCRGLSENQRVGPLLLDPELHDQYLGYVREFVTNVYSNKDFIRDIREHIAVIKDIAIESPDSETYGPFSSSSLLELMDRRSASVLKQLEDISNGEFPEEAGVSSRRACVTTSDDFSHFPEMCTSPDGAGGYDCCASDIWNEPQTCVDGYKPKKLDDFCLYTCVIDGPLSTGAIIGIIAGVASGVLISIVIAYYVCKQFFCKPTQEVNYGQPIKENNAINHHSNEAQGAGIEQSFAVNPSTSGNGAILYSK